MLVWIKGQVISPVNAKCSVCGGLLDEACLLLHIAPPIKNEDAEKAEPGYIDVKKVCCQACQEKSK